MIPNIVLETKFKKILPYLTENSARLHLASEAESLEVIVNLIANTTTTNGLVIKAKSDIKEYEKGIKITDEELREINLTNNEFKGNWNYKISP